jgi:hypothetical protein
MFKDVSVSNIPILKKDIQKKRVPVIIGFAKKQQGGTLK